MTTDALAGPRGTDGPAVPDVWLEQYRLDELDGRRRGELGARMASDPEVCARLAALARSDDETWRALDAPAFARAIVERASRARRRRATRPVLWLVPVAAGLMAAVWAGPWRPFRGADVGGTEIASETRVKGADASLEIYRWTGAGSERLADGDRAAAGDTVRIGYRVTAPLYGMIASVDGRGVVTRHHPAAGTLATALTPGDTVLLDYAFELDDAPRWEQFHLVTSPTPFDIDPVVRALADGDPARLPSALTRTVVSIVKEPRP
jgi:hypothetical protein